MAVAADLNDEFNPEDIEKAYEEARQELGRVNIVIIGKTGIGKSTLINTIVGREVVKTGVGAPVTKRLRYVHEKDTKIGIYDTVGFEIGKTHDELLQDIRVLVEPDEKLQKSIRCPHIVWFCIAGNSTRLEPEEEKLIHGISKLGIPIALVLTQTPSSGEEIHPRPLDLAKHIRDRKLPIVSNSAFLTCSQADNGLGMSKQFGLTELIGATFQAVADDAKSAFAAEQVLDTEIKDKAADREIYIAGAAAFAAGATPLPFSDAVVLVPAQIRLMMKIAHIYGFELQVASILSTVTTAVLRSAGVRIVSGLLKFIPGIGSFIGGAIAATTAGALTVGMGVAWKDICRRVYIGQLDPAFMKMGSEIANEFLNTYRGASNSAYKKFMRENE
jgi:small GTP-binding protein